MPDLAPVGRFPPHGHGCTPHQTQEDQGPVASNIERVNFRIPEKANPNNPAHMAKLLAKLAESKGEGWEIESVDTATATATAIRQVQITQISTASANTKKVSLSKDVEPSEGDRWAARLADREGPGWEMTEFKPFLGYPEMTLLSAEESLCRKTTATALGVKPWDIQVAKRRGGGFTIVLPDTYVASKHDSKLEEVATTVVGREGWYIKVDQRTRTCEFVPSSPPTFPGMLPTPMGQVKPFDAREKSSFLIPMGMKLPAPGEKTGEAFMLNMNAGSHMQVGGLSGAGKSVFINCYIANWLARGAELVIIDVPDKSVDFEWCKRFVRPGGWGCDSEAQSAVAINLVREEGKRRASIMRAAGVNNWKDLPPAKAFNPLVVVLDEVTGLFAPESVPKTNKNSPQMLLDMAAEAEKMNLFKAILKDGVTRVAAELRFVGVFLMLASQVAHANTGIEPKLRTNLHHKVLLGPKPTEANRRQIFSDADRVPQVPENIRSDGAANRSVGSAEPEGDEAFVFKGFFADTGDYSKWLDSLGVPTNPRPEPTSAQMAELEDAFESDGDMSATEQRRASMPDPAAVLMGDAGLDENGRPLKGAALAAAQSGHLARVGNHGGKP